MPAIPALIMAGGAIIGGKMASNASKKAADTQAASADKAADLQAEQYQQTRADQAPWREAGQVALKDMVGGLAAGGDFNRDFTMADYTEDPGYQFRLQEGEKGISRAATASGSRYSGATLKALSRFNSNQASQEYGNAYNRHQNDVSSRFNRLASLAGVGQTATNQTAAAGATAATNGGQFVQNAGTARASGYVGQANAINGTIGKVADIYSDYRLSQMAGSGGGAVDNTMY